MTWPKWVLVAWLSLGVFLQVWSIGKPRRTPTADAVAISLLFSAAAIWLVVIA